MKIAILGNGRMGKQISQLAKQRGHTIACISSSERPAHTLELNTSDIAIDFSTPTTAFNNISHALKSGIPVISGTTGWLDKLSEIEALCTNKSGAFLYASNFSLGMNIFFELNKKIRMVKTSSGSIAVDVKHDIKKVEKILKKNEKKIF